MKQKIPLLAMVFAPAAGNHQAAILTSPGLGFASTAPWVNFSF